MFALPKQYNQMSASFKGVTAKTIPESIKSHIK